MQTNARVGQVRQSRSGSRWTHGLLCMAGGAVILVTASPVLAVPSFSRQSGKSCSYCHTAFPELTAAGRKFKLEGYLLSNNEKVNQKTGDDTVLDINLIPALSAMLQVTDTFIKTQPDPTTASDGSDGKGIAAFPEEFSLFYGGEITPHMGAFIQATYAEGAFALDNTDIRYVAQVPLGDFHSLVLGLDANNNPTVQDAWNTTPAWGFPFAGSEATPGPSLGQQISSVGGAVAGVSGYAYLDDMIYAEAGVYRSSAGPDESIQGGAPYGRVAVDKEFGNHSVEIGSFGYSQRSYPAGTPAEGPRNWHNDVGADAQYQFVGEDHIVTTHATWIEERGRLDASVLAGGVSEPSSASKSLNVNAVYYFMRKVGLSVGYFSIEGNPDTLANAGSANGDPSAAGMVYEADYMPWRNTKFSLQYTAYAKYNGATKDYDGADRNAADNNTVMAMAWLMF